MDGLRTLAALLVLAACASAAVPSEPTAVVPSLPVSIPTGSVPPVPSPTAVPEFTPRVGACTSAGIGTRAMLERYFSLTSSGDAAAVLDCFARTYRERYDGADMRGSAIAFSRQGPLARLDLAYVDTVNGCDRYRAEFQFVTPDPLYPNGFGIFYTVGREDGAPRIVDGGTMLAPPERVTIVCA